MSHNEPAELRMVNDIIVNLQYLPAEQAATAVADHVKRFWDPRMKRRLIELVAAETEPLDPVVVAAAALLP
ncbi:MAG: formate dehydrogenase subunit delta [Mycobacterium sp.]|jgi:formate dehydrogenase subunit delta|nr:formate dehydrogenase subunit delta [Mycobacterium sp.]MDT5238143.1 formate dehydrogenase subunit delta [Mycobacterium sp.]MDT5298536.1 formate dehydrogenase subunit delta [Mycobacterium sp.]MDT5359500.1 formate dehydrogenase subunit delta [Mycobacterium sp.]